MVRRTSTIEMGCPMIQRSFEAINMERQSHIGWAGAPGASGLALCCGSTIPASNEEDDVADNDTSEAVFLGWLALGLIAFAVIGALVLAVAATRPM